VLIKLEHSFAIKKKAIFKIADMYFQIFVQADQLRLIKFESKNQEKKEYVFSPSDSPVTIGRNKKCKLPYVDEKSFSRVQTTIAFVNGKWEIKDGSDKPSTNGTWLYAQNSYEIQHGTCFRVYSSILKITLDENSPFK